MTLTACFTQLTTELEELKEVEAGLERQEREVDEDTTVTIPSAVYVPPARVLACAYPAALSWSLHWGNWLLSLPLSFRVLIQVRGSALSPSQ